MTVRLLSVHGQIAGLMWRHTFHKFEKNTQVSWFAVVSIGGNIAKQRLAEIFYSHMIGLSNSFPSTNISFKEPGVYEC